MAKEKDINREEHAVRVRAGGRHDLASGLHAGELDACGHTLIVDQGFRRVRRLGDGVAQTVMPLAQTVVWETHVGDFSNDPAGGFPESHRGKYPTMRGP